jgi:hypothetical protein
LSRLLTVAALGPLLLAAAAQAQTLTYEHQGKPLFSVTYPAGWLIDLDFQQEAEEAGAYKEGKPLELRIVEARPSDDRHLWVGIWVVPDATDLEQGKAYVASLRQDLFTDLEVSEPTSASLGGMPALLASGSARREGEPVELNVALFEPRAGIVAAALYVGKEDAWRDYRDELDAMATSIRPAR